MGVSKEIRSIIYYEYSDLNLRNGKKWEKSE